MDKKALKTSLKFLNETIRLSKVIRLLSIFQKTILIGCAVLTLGEMVAALKNMSKEENIWNILKRF